MKSASSPSIHVVTAAHSRPHGIAWFYAGASRHKAEQCVAGNAPAHARVLENTWVCNRGYRRDGEQCIKIIAPANAFIVENDWVCSTGYARRGEQCVQFAVPENAKAVGNSWFCHIGFTQEGERCVKLDTASAKEAGSVPGGDVQPALDWKSDDTASRDAAIDCTGIPAHLIAKCLEMQSADAEDDAVAQDSASKSGALPYLLVLLAAVLAAYGLLKLGRFRGLLVAKQGKKAGANNHAGQGPRGAAEGDGMNPKNAALDPKSNWYTILCVAENSSCEEIRKAYRRMITQYHPDKVEQLGEEIRALAQSKTKQINIAYDYAMTLRQSS